MPTWRRRVSSASRAVLRNSFAAESPQEHERHRGKDRPRSPADRIASGIVRCPFTGPDDLKLEMVQLPMNGASEVCTFRKGNFPLRKKSVRRSHRWWAHSDIMPRWV